MNMKREYIAPEVNVVKVHAERMLVGSDPDTITGSNDNDNPINEGWVEARGSFIFEEETEE